MNKFLFLLLVITLTSCSRFLPVPNTNSPNINMQTVIEEKKIEQEPEWLIIGGGRVDNYERPRKYDYYLKSELDKITMVRLYINPENETHPVNIDFIATSLEGIERLVNLQRLILVGWGMDDLDFSPLNSLQCLSNITLISGANDKLTKVPDLRAIASRESIKSITFEKCALTNMDNIEFLPNLRKILVTNNFGDLTNLSALSNLQYIEELEINSYGNSILFIEQIGAKPNLKRIKSFTEQIDVKGINKINSLEHIYFSDNKIINTEYLSGLKNLEYLHIMLWEPEPSIDFLKDMDSLKHLEIIDGETTTALNTYNDWESDQVLKKYRILDISPIGGLQQLVYLGLEGFIMKNVAVLDKLDNLERTNFLFSYLKDTSETSIKELTFHPDRYSYTPVWGIDTWNKPSR